MAGGIFHAEDLYLVPFSLLWGGFAIFWEAGVAGLWGTGAKAGTSSTFGMIWGIPFVVMGQYIIWGRFVYAAWKKRRTYYGVTNRRVIVVQRCTGRKMVSAYIDTLPTVIKEDGGGTAGTLRFAPPAPYGSGRRGWGAWDRMTLGDVPVLTDIEDVDGVYRMIAELRQRNK